MSKFVPRSLLSAPALDRRMD